MNHVTKPLINRELFPADSAGEGSEPLIERLEKNLVSGRRLLQKGLAKEASDIFDCCLKEDPLYYPALEGLAESYQKLGLNDKSRQYLQEAASIKQRMWERMVVADARKQSHLWG